MAAHALAGIRDANRPNVDAVHEFATLSDLTHVCRITSRSQMSRVFACCLFTKDNHVAADVFVAWARWYLLLPQLPVLYNEVVVPLHDVPMEYCAPCNALLDLNGNHAYACKATVQTRATKHNEQSMILAFAGREHGITGILTPKSVDLMHGRFSPQEM